MRLALLHYTCPSVAGGVERILADHARLFARHGHEVTVISGEGEASALGDARMNVRILPEIRRAPGNARLQPGDSPARTALDWRSEELHALLREQDVVFLHNVLTMPFHLGLTEALARIAEAERRTRFIAWVHDVAAANPAYAPAPPQLSRAYPAIEYVAVSGTRRRELCDATGLPAERCRVIPNGVDPLERLRVTPAVRRLAEEWHILERSAVLLHPTRLLRRKNVEASLKIAAALVAPRKSDSAQAFPKPPHADPLLLITGAADPHHAPSAAYGRELRALCPELALEKNACFISDHFSPTDADVDSLYTLADALIFPSWQEGFGLPVLEAALHRLPIFCRALETLTDLLPGGDVTVFDDKTPPAQIATDLMRQLEGSRTIRNRKAIVRDFGWPAIYQKYLAPLLADAETFPHP